MAARSAAAKCFQADSPACRRRLKSTLNRQSLLVSGHLFAQTEQLARLFVFVLAGPRLGGSSQHRLPGTVDPLPKFRQGLA
jgi:hypothetical protein